jgi:HTH-type transcriptional regulator/antitoxin HigA
MHIIKMVPAEIVAVEQAWPEMASVPFVPHTEDQYQRLVVFLDTLIDPVGEDEAHPLASLMEIMGILIAHYEDRYVPELSML